MQNLSLTEILQHLSVGLVACALGYLLRPAEAQAAWGVVGAPGVVLFAFVGGALLHYVYKPLVLNTVIRWMKDRLCNDDKRNPRRFLMGRYKQMRSRDAETLWFTLRVEHQGEPGLRAEEASVHFLYLAAILLLLSAYWAFLDPNVAIEMQLTVATILVGGAGFLLDRDVDRMGCVLLRSYSERRLDKLAESSGYSRM